MTDIHRILLIHPRRRTDAGSFERAAEIAARGGAQVVLVDVLEDGASMTEVMRGHLLETLELAAAPLRARGIAVECRLLSGPRLETLLAEARDGAYELIVKPASPRAAGGAGDRFESELVCQSPVPVWIVRGGEAAGSTVVAALEPDPRDGEGRALNERVLRAARAAAKLLDAELRTVRFLPTKGLRGLGGGGRVEIASPDAPVAAAPRITEAEGGDRARSIARAARLESAELLVVGTAGRRGLRRMLAGNTAEELLERIDGSLLVVGSPITDDGSRRAA